MLILCIDSFVYVCKHFVKAEKIIILLLKNCVCIVDNIRWGEKLSVVKKTPLTGILLFLGCINLSMIGN